jgi:hypothetical protein
METWAGYNRDRDREGKNKQGHELGQGQERGDG